MIYSDIFRGASLSSGGKVDPDSDYGSDYDSDVDEESAIFNHLSNY